MADVLLSSVYDLPRTFTALSQVYRRRRRGEHGRPLLLFDSANLLALSRQSGAATILSVGWVGLGVERVGLMKVKEASPRVKRTRNRSPRRTTDEATGRPPYRQGHACRQVRRGRHPPG